MMEEDVEMRNGYESDYPDPYAESPTPYPALARSSQPSAVQPDSDSETLAARPSKPKKLKAPAYTTLADYFSIGNISNNRLQGSDDEGEYHATSPSLLRPSGNVNGDEGSGNESSSSSHSPWTTPFFNRYGSGSPQPQDTTLPGFHALPETDAYYPETPPSQQSRYPGSVETSRYESPYSQSSTPRGRGRGRTPRESRGKSRGRPRGWKAALRGALQGTEHAALFVTPKTPRDPTAQRRGRKKGYNNRRKKQIDPGPDYSVPAGKANQAFFAEDYETARELIFEAIQANPEVYHGHVLFSEILEKQGRIRDALYAITNGAAVKRDPQIWMQIAERYLALEEAEQDPNDISSALRCYSEATKLDKDNCEIREAKLRLLLEIEDWKSARLECKGLVRIRPAELDYVRQYASLCNMTGLNEDRERACAAYETAFRLLSNLPPPGTPDEQWDHLNIYLDLLYQTQKPQQGIRQAKRIARWFLGRGGESYWDTFDIDDREYDIDNSRRGLIVQFQQGLVSRDASRYGSGLPLDIRVKMGMFRGQMGATYQPEALKHLEHLRALSSEIESFADMFVEVAECLRKGGSDHAAITFYEPLRAYPELVDAEFWFGIAQSYQGVGRNEEAEECYLKTIEMSNDHMDARMALIKLYRKINDKVKAVGIVNEVIRMGFEDRLHRERIRHWNVPKSAPKDKEDTSTASHPNKKMRSLLPARPASTRTRRASGGEESEDNEGLNLEWVEDRTARNNESNEQDQAKSSSRPDTASFRRLQAQEARVRSAYSKLKDLWPSLESGDDAAVQQWIIHAQDLAKDFKATKEFFQDHSRNKYFLGLKNGTKMQGSQAMKDMLALRQDLQSSVSNAEEAAVIQSIEGGAPVDWHGITFRELHRILSTLAIAHVDCVDQFSCYDILQSILMRANVLRYDSELQNTTLSVCICCALMFNDDRLMTETVQQWNFPGAQSSTAATHLVAAFGQLSHGDSYLYHRNTQHWAHFAVKKQDFLAMALEERGEVNWGGDRTRLDEMTEGRENDIEELNPALLTTYAHILGSKQGNSKLALSYLFRALALQPESIVINLSIAIAYLSMGLQQTDKQKRRFNLAQGEAFMERYYDLRTADGSVSHLQEAEYNFGRAWHMIGRMALAMPAYEKVLELSEEVQREGMENGKAEGEVEDFAKEAALTLRGMYVAAGNQDAARALTEKWLVL